MIVETLSVGPLQSNCYLVVDPETREGVVIDPGDEAERILQTISSREMVPQAVLLTHAHFDHIMAVRAIKESFDIPIYLHHADAEIYNYLEMLAGQFGLKADPPLPIDKYFEEGDIIPAGREVIRVIESPGHSPGGVLLELSGNPDRIFAGDTLFAGSVGRTDLPGGDTMRLIRSIREKLLVRDDNTIVYPGHGPETTIGAERQTNPFLQDMAS